MLSMKKRDGYTLMELLVVIAIIGVLAGLIFPVAASAKRKAKQAQCMNNMLQISVALKQFQLDEHKYPEFIAGPVQWKNNGRYNYDASGTIVPLNESTGMVGGSNGGNGRAVALYPEYINTINTLKCPFSDLNADYEGGMARPYSTGVVPVSGTPTQDDKSICEDPMYPILSGIPLTRKPFRGKGLEQDLNGDGSPDGTGPVWMYKYSSYDYQKPPKTPNPTTAPGEAHYAPARADYNGTPPIPVNVERQLRWRTPPENTVVTWCSFHRNVDMNGVPMGGSKDLVLFLDGHVGLQPSDQLIPWNTAGWTVQP